MARNISINDNSNIEGVPCPNCNSKAVNIKNPWMGISKCIFYISLVLMGIPSLLMGFVPLIIPVVMWGIITFIFIPKIRKRDCFCRTCFYRWKMNIDK